MQWYREYLCDAVVHPVWCGDRPIESNSKLMLLHRTALLTNVRSLRPVVESVSTTTRMQKKKSHTHTQMFATQSRYYRIELLVAVTGVRLSFALRRSRFSFLLFFYVVVFASWQFARQKKNTPNEIHTN